MDKIKLRLSTMKAIAESPEDCSVGTYMAVSNSRLSDTYIRNVANLVSLTWLYRLSIYMEQDEGRIHILKSINWNALHQLSIGLEGGRLMTMVMITLLDGVKKGHASLTEFSLASVSISPFLAPLVRELYNKDLSSLASVSSVSMTMALLDSAKKITGIGQDAFNLSAASVSLLTTLFSYDVREKSGNSILEDFDLNLPSTPPLMVTSVPLLHGSMTSSGIAALEELNRTSAPISPLMRDLFNGVSKEPGLDIASDILPLSGLQFDLLKAFLASTSLEVLVLEVILSIEQILSLFRSADFPQLKRLRLCAKGFTTSNVEAIIRSLQYIYLASGDLGARLCAHLN
jgi:hypothetical protein